jgi:predicted dehydrogenase
MLKGAFMGGPEAFGQGPAALAAGGLEVAAWCPSPGRGVFSLPAGAVKRAGAEELFAVPGLQFAALSLPPKETFQAARLALARGLHVFCEPPFCRSTSEFEDLREAADEAGRVLFACQPWEHSPACRALEKAITRGLAGEITFAFARLEFPWPGPADWTASPEAWQAASLLLGAVRRPPSAVEARLSGGDSAAFHVQFGRGDGFIHLAAGAAKARLRVSVSGAAGALELDGSGLRLEPRGLPPEDLQLSDGAAPGEARPAWLKAEFANFRKEIDGALPRGAGLRNARYCVKLLKNAAASAANRSAAIPL